MHILLSPDKFKGSLSALDVALALEAGFREVMPSASFDLAPIADGGEGTAEAFVAASGGEWIDTDTHDALGQAIVARYGWLPGSRTALIEMCAASGHWRIKADELNPLDASTFGTGELMLHAIAQGAESICLFLGGSATNDAGVGMAAALGWKFLDALGENVPPIPREFHRIAKILPQGAPQISRLSGLCDVKNPLLGPLGTTRVFGPQKGADLEMIEVLESALAHLASLCRHQLGTDFAETPGAGAAGGLGFGLLTFGGGSLEPGFEAVSRILHLEKRIAKADLVVTGEGRVDSQSLHGKAPVELAILARRMNKPVVAFAGLVEPGVDAFDCCIPIAGGPMRLDESISKAGLLVRESARRTAQLLTLGARNPHFAEAGAS